MNPKALKTITWIKEAATNIWRLVLGIILLFLGAFILVLVGIASSVFYFATINKKRMNLGEILVSNGSFSKSIAIGIDILGAICGKHFFNWLFLKEARQFPFGIAGQRISSVIQWNYLINNLTKSGMRLYKILEFLEKDHCNKSVQTELRNAQKMIELNKAL